MTELTVITSEMCGETIKAYLRSDSHDVQDLQLIPLVFAGWLRYLMGIDDNGDPFELSPDPLLPTVLPFVKGQAPGQTAGSDLGQQEEAYGSNASHLDDLLRNEAVFGVDLVAAGLAEKVKDLFRQLCEGPGAVRRTLHLLVQGQATN